MTKDGGPAFPIHTALLAGGMSLRDWFAGQALAGFMGHPQDASDPSACAEHAYKVADAMMAQRDAER